MLNFLNIALEKVIKVNFYYNQNISCQYINKHTSE